MTKTEEQIDLLLLRMEAVEANNALVLYQLSVLCSNKPQDETRKYFDRASRAMQALADAVKEKPQ